MLKKLTGTEFALLLLCVMFAVLFFGVGLEVYGLRRENKKLAVDIQTILAEREVDRDFLFRGISKNHNNILSLRKIQNRLSSQTQVLEASLDSQEMRWARIKKVRDAIKIVSNSALPVDEATEIASAVVDNADEYDIPAALVLAVIRQESNFNRHAISSANAKGLMQVMTSTAADIKSWVGWKYYSWSKPSHNIKFGTLYLARMFHSFEDNENYAISSYNCGAICVEKVRAGKWANYPNETIRYLEMVKQWKKDFEQQGVTW